MARKTSKWLLTGVVASMIAACGGGGSTSSGGGGGTTEPAPVQESAPPVTGAATATLTESSTGASDLVAKTKDAASGVATVSGFTTLVAGAQAAGGATGAGAGPMRALSARSSLTSTSTANCTYGGTVDRSSSYASASAPTAGDRLLMTFHACAQASSTLLVQSGTVENTILRFVSDSDLAFNYKATNVLFKIDGVDRGPYTFSGQLDLAGGQVSWSYVSGKLTVVGEPQVVKTASSHTVQSGVARFNLAGGFVEVAFTDWVFDPATLRASRGHAVVKAKGQQTATVDVVAGGYDVTMQTTGASNHYLVPF